MQYPHPNLCVSLLLVLVISWAGHIPICADESKKDITENKVNQVTWGEPLKGCDRPAFEPAKLAGKIVIIEEFGVRIPDCIGRIADLNRLAKKLERDKVPFTIVMLHRQIEVPDKDVLKEVKRLHPSIVIRKNGFTPVFYKGMPNTSLFSQDGAMQWKGDPRKSAYRRALKNLLKSVKQQ